MKKTFNINLGGIVFHIDEDAYELLDQYLSNLRIHFSKEAVVGDFMEIWMTPKMEPREGADQDCRYLFRTVRKSDGQMNIACEIGLVPVK